MQAQGQHTMQASNAKTKPRVGPIILHRQGLSVLPISIHSGKKNIVPPVHTPTAGQDQRQRICESPKYVHTRCSTRFLCSISLLQLLQLSKHALCTCMCTCVTAGGLLHSARRNACQQVSARADQTTTRAPWCCSMSKQLQQHLDRLQHDHPIVRRHAVAGVFQSLAQNSMYASKRGQDALQFCLRQRHQVTNRACVGKYVTYARYITACTTCQITQRFGFTQ